MKGQLVALFSVCWHAGLAVSPVAPASEEVEVFSGGALLRRELHRLEQTQAALQEDVMEADKESHTQTDSHILHRVHEQQPVDDNTEAEATPAAEDDEAFDYESNTSTAETETTTAAAIVASMPSWALPACVQNNIAYIPLNMPNENASVISLWACRDRCRSVQGCAHFSISDLGTCHLQSNDSNLVNMSGFVSSTPNCSEVAQESMTLNASSEPIIDGCKGGQCCYQTSMAHAPLDMPGVEGSREPDYGACQARCLQSSRCHRFTYFHEQMGCHLQDGNATPYFVSGAISGRWNCSGEERAAFDNFLASKRQGASGSGEQLTKLQTCDDSWQSFLPFDVDTSDLQQNDDWLSPNKSVKCSDLYSFHRTQAVCLASQQIQEKCPLLCGECGIQAATGGCSDKGKDDAPIFWANNVSVGCNVLAYACSHDEDVAEKCRETCGWCNISTTATLSSTTSITSTTTTTTMTQEPTEGTMGEVLGCNRRRSMGYCFSRRRRLF